MTFGPNNEFSNKYRRLVIKSSVTIQRGCLDWNTCAHVPEGGLRCVTWNTRGLLGSPSSSQSSRERKHNCFIRFTRSNDIFSLQEIHGKDEVLQAIQVLAPRFKLHGTFIFICIHKDLLPDEAVVTHVVTCQGRGCSLSTRCMLRLTGQSIAKPSGDGSLGLCSFAIMSKGYVAAVESAHVQFEVCAQ